MIRRRIPHSSAMEEALRSALLLAADSVEPGADGLDRIRAKISAGRPPAGASSRRIFQPAAVRLRLALRTVIGRFTPEPGRAGWLGWLRPAAALATGVFVMAAASWAVAALPQAIAPSTNTRSLNPSRSASARPHTSTPGYPYGGGPYPTSASSASPTCSPSSLPTGSPSASPSGTPSPSPSPSGSASPSPTASPSPSDSPSAEPTDSDLTSPPAITPADDTAAAGPGTQPSPPPVSALIATPAPAPSPSGSAPGSPSPSPSSPASPGPCASPSP